MVLVLLGRLDTKMDFVLQRLPPLAPRTSTALPTSTRGPRRMSGRPRSPRPTPPPQQDPHSDESLLLTVLKHIAPKALLWALGRAFAILAQFLIPTLLLMWALMSKWVGIAWGLLSSAFWALLG